MGWSKHAFVGPYLILPDARITEEGEPKLACPTCVDNDDRPTGRFCATCGAALVTVTKTYETNIDLFAMDVEEDRWFQPESLQVVISNHKNPHGMWLDPMEPKAIDLANANPDAAIAWFRDECAPITAWLAAKGLPPPTFAYGVLVYVM